MPDDDDFALSPETPVEKAIRDFLCTTADIGLGHISVNETNTSGHIHISVRTPYLDREEENVFAYECETFAPQLLAWLTDQPNEPVRFESKGEGEDTKYEVEITGIDPTKLALVIKAQALSEAISGNYIELSPSISIGRTEENEPVLEVILNTSEGDRANYYLERWLQNSNNRQTTFELEEREFDGKLKAALPLEQQVVDALDGKLRKLHEKTKPLAKLDRENAARARIAMKQSNAAGLCQKFDEVFRAMGLSITEDTQIIGNDFVTQIRISPDDAEKIDSLLFTITKPTQFDKSWVHLNAEITSSPPKGEMTEMIQTKGDTPIPHTISIYPDTYFRNTRDTTEFGGWLRSDEIEAALDVALENIRAEPDKYKIARKR